MSVHTPRVFRTSLHVLALALVALNISCANRYREGIKPDMLTTEETVFLSFDDVPAFAYQYQASPFKPYLSELWTPSGVNVLLDGPADHLHHHGLMFALTVDGVNFWEETAASGRQIWRDRMSTFSDTRTSRHEAMARSGLAQTLDWRAPDDNDPLLTERRVVQAFQHEDMDMTLIDWVSEFRVGAGRQQVELSGSHYAGLGLRLRDVTDDEAWFINRQGVEGQVFRGEERLVEADWCAFLGTLEGFPVTVAMFDHPANLRQPASWFHMQRPFAYLSATLALHERPVTVTREQPLFLIYGVAVWDGYQSVEVIEAAYQRWLTLEQGELDAL